MQIKFTNKGNILVASIIGELDHHTAEYIRDRIDGELLKSINKNIIFDFSKVSFMDSSGLGVILGRYKKLKDKGGKLYIRNANTQIEKVFTVSGIYQIIKKIK